MIGFFIFLPTVIHMPSGLYLIALAAALFQNPKLAIDLLNQLKSKKVSPHFWGFLIIYVLILLNGFFGLLDTSLKLEQTASFPYLIFLPFTLFISKSLKTKDIRVLVYLICVESVVAWLEYVFGVTTFFGEGTGELTYQNSDLLYFRRPYGFSPNSSGLAAKAFIALLLLSIVDFGKKIWYIIPLLVSVVIITFARTVFVALFAFAILYAFNALFQKKIRLLYFQIAFVLCAVVGVFIILNYEPLFEIFIKQFTRDTGQIELTGRDKIWADFLAVFYESPISGTYSNKLMFGPYHAHNSFLQTLASNGLVISFGLFVFVLTKLKPWNWVPTISILVYSFAQYGIFWGISLMDCVFFFFLFMKEPSILQTVDDKRRYNAD